MYLCERDRLSCHRRLAGGCRVCTLFRLQLAAHGCWRGARTTSNQGGSRDDVSRVGVNIISVICTHRQRTSTCQYVSPHPMVSFINEAQGIHHTKSSHYIHIQIHICTHGRNHTHVRIPIHTHIHSRIHIFLQVLANPPTVGCWMDTHT
jgi:hypothetical protein